MELIKPLGDNVLVKEDERPEKEGGIYLPPVQGEDDTWEPTYGVVVGVGPGGSDASVGDRVAFDPWIGTPVPYEGVTYRLLERDEVLAVLEGA